MVLYLTIRDGFGAKIYFCREIMFIIQCFTRTRNNITPNVLPPIKSIPTDDKQDSLLMTFRTKEARLTRIAIGIVSLYLLCHVWRLIPTIYELINGDETYPSWLKHVLGFSHNMIVLNSAINFLLFVVL